MESIKNTKKTAPELLKFGSLPRNVMKETKEALVVALENIDVDEYNSDDGQMRFLENQCVSMHLKTFWKMIPPKIKEKMTHWKCIDLPFETAKFLREKLLAFTDKEIEHYNTEDGQIRFLEDNNLFIHLGNFWTGIPGEVKKKMTHWKCINLPFETAKYVREKLLALSDQATAYNPSFKQIEKRLRKEETLKTQRIESKEQETIELIRNKFLAFINSHDLPYHQKSKEGLYKKHKQICIFLQERAIVGIDQIQGLLGDTDRRFTMWKDFPTRIKVSLKQFIHQEKPLIRKSVLSITGK